MVASLRDQANPFRIAFARTTGEIAEEVKSIDQAWTGQGKKRRVVRDPPPKNRNADSA
jgi:hypothetical protein